MRYSTLWLCVLSLTISVACGKRDDPTPPVPVIPQATSDLVVAQRGQQVILGWSYPTLSTAGRNLPAVDSIEVLRLVESLPPDAAATGEIPAAADAGEPWEKTLFSTVSLPSPVRFNRDADTIATLSGDRIPAAVAGSRVIFVDEPDLRDDQGRPVRISYAVRTTTGDASSDTGNIVSIVPLELSGPPRNLRAEARASDVALNWEPPADATERPPIGYFVYRFGADGVSIDAGKPVNEAPVDGTSYSDSPPLGVWSYTVTAVRDAGPPAVESAPAELVRAEFRDVLAPPPPGEVLTLLEDPAVRIVWTESQAADLEGYLVYRSVEGGARVKLTPAPVTSSPFRDANPPRGASYVYAVSSIDRAGNESEPTVAATVIIPPR